MLKRFLDEISNRADWESSYNVTDGDTGTNIDLSTATIVFAIKKYHDDSDDDDLIQGTITIPSVGFFTVLFTRDQLRDLQGTYDVGCTIEIAGVTTQFIVGRLPVIDGAVPQ